MSMNIEIRRFPTDKYEYYKEISSLIDMAEDEAVKDGLTKLIADYNRIGIIINKDIIIAISENNILLGYTLGRYMKIEKRNEKDKDQTLYRATQIIASEVQENICSNLLKTQIEFAKSLEADVLVTEIADDSKLKEIYEKQGAKFYNSGNYKKTVNINLR